MTRSSWPQHAATWSNYIRWMNRTTRHAVHEAAFWFFHGCSSFPLSSPTSMVQPLNTKHVPFTFPKSYIFVLLPFFNIKIIIIINAALRTRPFETSHSTRRTPQTTTTSYQTSSSGVYLYNLRSFNSLKKPQKGATLYTPNNTLVLCCGLRCYNIT